MKGMKKYYTQKIMWYLLTLVFAVLLNFILPRLMPGDPVSTIASKSVEGMTDATAIQKVYEDYAAKFGINKPMYVQFFTWVKNALRGDFGISFSQYPRTVSDIISSSVLWTICLQLPAIIVGWILGNLLGAIAAYMKGVFDKAILPAFLFISNVPAFGMATVLLFVFSLKLHIAPAAGGYASSMIPHMSLAFMKSVLSHYQLPFWSIVIITIGGYTFAIFVDPDEGGKFYWLDNKQFSPSIPDPAQGLFFSKLGAYVEFPAIAGKVLSEVHYLPTSQQNDVSLDLFGADNSEPQYTLDYGDDGTWSYTLIDARENLRYRIEITNKKNAQLAKLKLVYAAAK